MTQICHKPEAQRYHHESLVHRVLHDLSLSLIHRNTQTHYSITGTQSKRSSLYGFLKRKWFPWWERERRGSGWRIRATGLSADAAQLRAACVKGSTWRMTALPWPGWGLLADLPDREVSGHQHTQRKTQPPSPFSESIFKFILLFYS